MPRTHTGSVAVIHRVDASFRPCFLELLQASGGARTTSRCGSRRLGIVSIYPYRAHTAEEPVGDGPRGRCYGPVNPVSLSANRVGRGLKQSLIAGHLQVRVHIIRGVGVEELPGTP